jgi:dTDP-glucose 4,6-dehydratase
MAVFPMEHPILVTGGAGFIGSNFVMEWAKHVSRNIVVLDKLTYSGNLKNLESLHSFPEFRFVHCDVSSRDQVRRSLQDFQPGAIFHFAAESHVDRSIHNPEDFVRTNVLGTFCLLDESWQYYQAMDKERQQMFRFLHVSTDEVYGSLNSGDAPFSEASSYAPNSPYAASKAASDHLVRAYHHTFGLPTLITNCSNNYGPYQFPDKLIPLVILRALKEEQIPVYGDGSNVRDWIYVIDHCQALRGVLEKGRPGETYNLGGRSEKTNLDVVRSVCSLLDELRPRRDGQTYSSLITFVADRPGHDYRYAIDNRKVQSEVGWSPQENFETGIRKTVLWYLENSRWVEDVSSGAYLDWIATNYKLREAQCEA